MEWAEGRARRLHLAFRRHRDAGVIPALSASAGYDPANSACVIDKVRSTAT